MLSGKSVKGRIHAFDWLRIIAFGLLILYHGYLPFHPYYTYHVSDPDKSYFLFSMLDWMQYWRLHLLFFISGFGTYFALRKVSGSTFLKERSMRLGLPLLFGIWVICPPQIWVERITQYGNTKGFFTFYLQDYFTSGNYPQGNITWNHLWFLPYLLLMTLLLLPLFLYLRNSIWLKNKQFGQLSIFRSTVFLSSGVILPILASSLLWIWPIRTMGLFDDWGWFTIWSTFFFLGFIVALLRNEVLPLLRRTRWVFLFLCVACFVVRFTNLLPEHEVSGQLLLRSLSWFAILALSGFALVYLNQDSTLKRYLNTAIFPIYVLHQTIIILVAYWMLDTGWSIGFKYIIIIISTLVGFVVMYEGFIKKIGSAGVLFGLKPKS